MEKEIMILVYNDKIHNKDYYLEFNVNSLVNLANELIYIKSKDKNKFGENKFNRFINCINGLISGNPEALDVLLYQNEFTNKYSNEIKLLEEISIKKIASDSVEDIMYGNAIEDYKKAKEEIDLLKEKQYFEETLYREYLLKILGCLNLTVINEKNIKKVK